MAYGLTSEGFVPKRLTDVIDSINTRARAAFGEDINVNEDSVMGQVIGVFAAECADLWELGEAVYNGFIPSAAEGKQLDDCANLVGVSRLPATATTVEVEYVGDPGTVIPLGMTVSMSSTQDQFEVLSSITLDETDATEALITVSSVANNTAYSVTVNGFSVAYTSDGSATANEITAGLKAAFDLVTGLTAIASCTNNGNSTITITLLSGELSGDTRLSFATSANLTITKVAKSVESQCTETGPLYVAVGKVDTIETPTGGLDSVRNRIEGILGRDEESDEDLRTRRLIALANPAAATRDAIVAAVRAVDGVSDVYLIENIEVTVDGDGRPGKSFEVIVNGGSNADVAQAIWDTKPAGIETTNRNTAAAVTAYDSDGNAHDVYFSRPAVKDIYIEVDYTLFSEEDFPTGGAATIADVVVEYGSTIGIGKDVIPQRFFGPIFEAVPGIESLVVRVSDDGVAWQTTKLTVDAFEIPTFALARVSVTLV